MRGWERVYHCQGWGWIVGVVEGGDDGERRGVGDANGLEVAGWWMRIYALG